MQQASNVSLSVSVLNLTTTSHKHKLKGVTAVEPLAKKTKLQLDRWCLLLALKCETVETLSQRSLHSVNSFFMEKLLFLPESCLFATPKESCTVSSSQPLVRTKRHSLSRVKINL